MVRVQGLNNEWFAIYAPYNELFKEMLKQEVPYTERKWNKEQRRWEVKYLFSDDALEVVYKFFGYNILFENFKERGAKQQEPAAKAHPDAYELLFVKPGAPTQVIKAAYRALAMMYHPDLNDGDDATEKMKELNVAFEKIMKTREGN